MTVLSSKFSSVRSRSNSVSSAPKTMTARDFLSVIRRHLLLIAACIFVAAAIAAWIVSAVTPLYQAEGQLLLGEQGRGDQSSDLQASQLLNNSVIEGELAILRSSSLLARVVERLNLVETTEFNISLRPAEELSLVGAIVDQVLGTIEDTVKLFLPKPPEYTGIDGSDGEDGATSELQRAAMANPETNGEFGEAIQLVRKSIRVRQLGASFVVSVQATSSDPQISAAVSNTVMTEYIRFIADKRYAAATKFTKFLESRVAELAVTLEASEREALAFRAVLESDADSSARLNQQMRELTSKLVDARAELAEASSRSARAGEIRDESGLLAAADVLTSDVVLDFRTQLARMQGEMANSIRIFGPSSPQVVSIERSVTKLEKSLRREVERTILQLDNTVQIYDINVGALEQSLRRLEGLILTRSNDQIQLNQLTKVAEANRNIYEDFLGRFKQTSGIQNLQTADAEVLSFASPPSAPTSPNKKLTVALSSVGGLFLGLAAALLLETAPKRLGTTSELAGSAGLVNLGSLPSVVNSAKPSRLMSLVSSKPDSKLVRAGQILLKNVNLHSTPPPASIIVTGDTAGGGKSNLALMLARAEANSGKTCLLIDADTRTATLSRDLCPKTTAELSKVLYDYMPLTEAALTLPNYGIDLLPTVVMSADPSMVFASQRAALVFREAMALYDVVIFDAPALTNWTEILQLRLKIDLAIFTGIGGQTVVEDIEGYLELFDKLTPKETGTVLIESRRYQT